MCGVTPRQLTARTCDGEDMLDIEGAVRDLPVRHACLASALQRSEPRRVWGGEMVQHGQDPVQAGGAAVHESTLRPPTTPIASAGTPSTSWRRLSGVGAEYLDEHAHRENRGDHQQAVTEEGIQADRLAQRWPAV